MNRRGLYRRRRFVPLALALTACCAGRGQEPAADPQAELHISVVGASVSAGFGNQSNLTQVLTAALRGPCRVDNRATELFFTRPAWCGNRLLQPVHRDPPDLVIALDYLFWFAYGKRSPAARRRLLDTGLKQLAHLPCPVIAGDLPAMPPGLLLHQNMIPAAAELKQLNRTIHHWARKQLHVTLVPLADTMAALRAGRPLRINGKPRLLPDHKIFCFDKLHLTRPGLVILSAVTLPHVTVQDPPPLPADRVHLDPDAITTRLRRLTAPRTKP